MCGRYVFYDQNNKELSKLMNDMKERLPKKEFEEISLFEVFPSQKALAAVNDPKKNIPVIKVMQWGLMNHSRLVINARSETCFTASFFHGCVPCALPASSYFEWTKDHQKYAFCSEHETIYLAGLARQETDGWHFVILTEPALEQNAYIHARQPLAFTYENAKKWCTAKHPTSLYNLSISKRTASKV